MEWDEEVEKHQNFGTRTELLCGDAIAKNYVSVLCSGILAVRIPGRSPPY